MKSELVHGRIPVLECLRAKKRPARRLFLLRDVKDVHDILALAGGIPIEYTSRQDLDRRADGQTHQGVILEADPLPVRGSADWKPDELPADAVVVLLDGIEDPHNFGAIVRSAAAFGSAAVIFPKDRAAPISPASVKAAAGAMEYIDLVRVTNLVRAIEDLQAARFWVHGLDAAAEKTLWEADLKGRTALVVGNEGDGMRRLVRERCDVLVRIPVSGSIPSLNASVSAAVALAECVRQRSAPAS